MPEFGYEIFTAAGPACVSHPGDPPMTVTQFPPGPAPTPKGPTAHTAPADPLWRAAAALESQFLTEMLKSAGLGKPREAFGGGGGEDQFASFLVREQADRMVAAGGIGLAERLFDSLKARGRAGE
jgi:hypothetical protein